MDIRDAMIIAVGSKEYGVNNGQGVAIFWDKATGQYNVYEEDKGAPDTLFTDVESAVDYFLKITEDDRITRTDEEAELDLPSPLERY